MKRIPHRLFFRPIRRIILALAIVIGLPACNNLTSVLFFPDTTYYQTPENFGIDYRQVSIETYDKETLVSWYLNAKTPAKASILFLHGNGENISTHINSVAWLTHYGFHVFLLDYRGYGLSSGTSTLDSALSDVKDAHHWLSDNEPLPLILLGQSMGGSIAINYAAIQHKGLKEFKALATESSPANWPLMAKEAMNQSWVTWALQCPVYLALPSKYNAEKHISNITIPVMLMHSREDTIVPFHHSERLRASAKLKPKWRETRGGHISGFANEDTRREFIQFLYDTLDK